MAVTHFSGPIAIGSGSIVNLAAATTLTGEDSGKTFFLNLAGGFAVTLPAPSSGYRFKFIVKVAPTTAYTIVTNSSNRVIIGGINELEVDTADDGPYDDDGDIITFVANTALVGDWVDMISDGTSWYITGQTKADGGATIAGS